MSGKRKTADFFMAENQAPLKKFRRLERRVNALKPEMKHETFTLATVVTPASPLDVSNLTQISQGDGQGRRTANKIKVWRIEIRGVASSQLDTLIVQAHGGTPPAAANFTAGEGTFIVDDDLNTAFTEWRHYRNLSTQDNGAPYKLTVRFKTGINVHYDGISTTPASNGLYFVAYNGTTSDRPINLTARVWFTDV